MPSDGYVEGHRNAVVTADNHGPVLEIIVWFLMVVMICAALLKLAVRSIARGLGLDDLLVSIGLLFGIGEVISLSLGVNHGLGKKADLLDDGQIGSVLKSLYASSLLYILTLLFAKISIIWLMTRLFVEKRWVVVNQAMGGLVLAWAVSAFFAVAFQCGASRPWNTRGDQCYNVDVFWYLIGAFDILTDLSCVVFPTLIVRQLQMDFSRKVIVLSAFWLRIFVIAASITRLVLLSNLAGTTPTPADDPTYPIAFWIATMTQTAFAVVASCAPALKPFMGASSSGLLGVSLTNREGTYNVSGSYAMQNLSKQNGSAGTPNGTANGGSRARDFSANRTSHKATVSSRKGGKGGSRTGTVDEEEGYTDNVSEKYMIRKTTGYEVVYSEDQQREAGMMMPSHSLSRPSAEEIQDSGSRRGYNAV